LTLGTTPGEASDYEERGRLLREWMDAGILEPERQPSFYVYAIDYTIPGSARAARMLGLTALGGLHPFEERVVLPHERTFPKVVDDRQRLLEATRTNLESILLLYSDPERSLDRLLEEHARARPAIGVEARPGEVHALYPVSDTKVGRRLTELMRPQRPIIADGHHRYTTSLRYCQAAFRAGQAVPGARWQMMTFANLFSAGVSILATHRLLKLRAGTAAEALSALRSRLEPAAPGNWDFLVETPGASCPLRVPEGLRGTRSGAARTNYGLLHDLILGDWLLPWAGEAPEIHYFKEGTGEAEALRRGQGDLLFRMRPVDRKEFQAVVRGGELFPHKTTYFYPKLWSGLVLWTLEEPRPLELE
jgi:uncharacterized protein (DUF1015 family)